MRILLAIVAGTLAGCGTTGAPQPEPPAQPERPAAAPPARAAPPKTPSAPSAPSARGGGYYKDDGPGDSPPPNLASLPDAVPRYEPPHRFANRPYQVFGRDYVPLRAGTPYRERGLGSWYGRRFHGSSTSNGERYDMYAMTAAHPVLPIPSYARVTNLTNGKSVVVRINDRGPFHAGRLIDLSYAAAFRLGYIEAGSAQVEVEAILPGNETALAAAPKQTPAQAPSPIAVAKSSGAEATQTSSNVFLQLGAFAARENAESLRARMAQELSWLSEVVQVFASGGLFRLQLGPYRSQDEARSVAERIFSELSLRPVVVVR